MTTCAATFGADARVARARQAPRQRPRRPVARHTTPSASSASTAARQRVLLCVAACMSPSTSSSWLRAPPTLARRCGRGSASMRSETPSSVRVATPRRHPQPQRPAPGARGSAHVDHAGAASRAGLVEPLWARLILVHSSSPHINCFVPKSSTQGQRVPRARPAILRDDDRLQRVAVHDAQVTRTRGRSTGHIAS